MIIKELDRIETTDKFEQAGYRAESQLAFYLNREFKDDPLFLVFNNLRFEKAGDACQIDHLVIHRYGMIIIESKSVTTRVEVNELGEWKRLIMIGKECLHQFCKLNVKGNFSRII
jgi:hypothetical protein